ncbi:hypothetical protein SOASR031_09960 [Leminorella grimontii]|nr:hypothetical protein SOASR031_09960 [Leminorella grimontii]
MTIVLGREGACISFGSASGLGSLGALRWLRQVDPNGNPSRRLTLLSTQFQISGFVINLQRRFM